MHTREKPSSCARFSARARVFFAYYMPLIAYCMGRVSTSSHILCPVIAYCMVDETGSLGRCFRMLYGSASHLHRIFDGPALHIIWPNIPVLHGQHRIPSSSRAVWSRIACYGHNSVLYGPIRILYGPAPHTIWSAIAYYMARVVIKQDKVEESR